MAVGRRTVVLSFITSLVLGGKPQDAQQQQPPRPGLPPPQSPDNQDHRLPNGKSQLNAIAIHNHEQALKEANELVELAGQLRNDLQQAGTYVVPLSSLKKTEEIEKLARRIRNRLKA